MSKRVASDSDTEDDEFSLWVPARNVKRKVPPEVSREVRDMTADNFKWYQDKGENGDEDPELAFPAHLAPWPISRRTGTIVMPENATPRDLALILKAHPPPPLQPPSPPQNPVGGGDASELEDEDPPRMSTVEAYLASRRNENAARPPPPPQSPIVIGSDSESEDADPPRMTMMEAFLARRRNRNAARSPPPPQSPVGRRVASASSDPVQNRGASSAEAHSERPAPLLDINAMISQVNRAPPLDINALVSQLNRIASSGQSVRISVPHPSAHRPLNSSSSFPLSMSSASVPRPNAPPAPSAHNYTARHVYKNALVIFPDPVGTLTRFLTGPRNPEYIDLVEREMAFHVYKADFLHANRNLLSMTTRQKVRVAREDFEKLADDIVIGCLRLGAIATLKYIERQNERNGRMP